MNSHSEKVPNLSLFGSLVPPLSVPLQPNVPTQAVTAVSNSLCCPMYPISAALQQQQQGREIVDHFQLRCAALVGTYQLKRTIIYNFTVLSLPRSSDGRTDGHGATNGVAAGRLEYGLFRTTGRWFHPPRLPACLGNVVERKSFLII